MWKRLDELEKQEQQRNELEHDSYVIPNNFKLHCQYIRSFGIIF